MIVALLVGMACLLIIIVILSFVIWDLDRNNTYLHNCIIDLEELMKIEELNLSTHAHHALKRAGIDTVEEIRTMTDKELLDLKGIGRGTLAEIREAVPKRITNYERITGMTVEQMARWMAERVTIIECVHSEVHMIKGGAGLDPEVMNALADQMYEAHLEWLMQPVGEDPDVE